MTGDGNDAAVKGKSRSSTGQGGKGKSGGGGGGAPALRWVSQRDLRAGAEGLTAGVRKVLSLAHALQGAEGQEKKKKGQGSAATKNGAAR